MKWKRLAAIAGILTIAFGQSSSRAIVVNLDSANWTRDKESESVLVHSDQTTGGMELLVRFPAGHVIPPHSHDSNERVIVVEGQLKLGQDSGDVFLNTGGFAFLPAHEVQRLSCSSKTRCSFYLIWDGNPQSHAAK
jgi:quercetin dioxygenase-like cupin family protein